MRGFKLEVTIDDEGQVKSNLDHKDMDSVEIVAMLEIQKAKIIDSIINLKKDEGFKAEILEE